MFVVVVVVTFEKVTKKTSVTFMICMCMGFQNVKTFLMMMIIMIISIILIMVIMMMVMKKILHNVMLFTLAIVWCECFFYIYRMPLSLSRSLLFLITLHRAWLINQLITSMLYFLWLIKYMHAFIMLTRNGEPNNSNSCATSFDVMMKEAGTWKDNEILYTFLLLYFFWI